jgi:hypothetical protein
VADLSFVQRPFDQCEKLRVIVQHAARSASFQYRYFAIRFRLVLMGMMPVVPGRCHARSLTPKPKRSVDGLIHAAWRSSANSSEEHRNEEWTSVKVCPMYLQGKYGLT